MGKFLSKIFGSKEIRILMLGLDASGKTSMFTKFVFNSNLLMLCFSYTLQIKIWSNSNNNTDGWFQC